MNNLKNWDRKPSPWALAVVVLIAWGWTYVEADAGIALGRRLLACKSEAPIEPGSAAKGPTLPAPLRLGLAAPVCGVRTSPTQAQQLGWPTRSLRWALVGEGPPGFNAVETKLAIGKAFRIWSDACGATFTEASADSAEMLVSFVVQAHAKSPEDNDSDPPFRGPGEVLAHAFYPGPGIGGDVHVDASEPWRSGLDLVSTLGHEIGHALGFEHRADANSLMFAAYNGRTSLSTAEIRDAQALYGKPANAAKTLLDAAGELKPQTRDLEFTSPSTPTTVTVKAEGQVTWTLRRKGGRATPANTGSRRYALDGAGPWIVEVSGLGQYKVTVSSE